MIRLFLRSGILGLIGTIILGCLAVMRIGTPIFIVYALGFGFGLIGVVITCIEKLKSHNKRNS